MGNDLARRWAAYDKTDGWWIVKIHDRNSFLPDVYADVYNDVQKNCEFQSVEEISDTIDVSYYKCNDVVLGFNLDDRSGVIRNRPVPKTNTE